jgi:DNA helicase-2/ATP-dependent DNA helicase PcrA
MRASGEPEVEDPHLVDERKLFYVAATRARDLLIVGTADVVNKRGGGPSPFVYEMFGEDLSEAADLSRARVEQVTSEAAEGEATRRRFSYSELAYYLQCPMRYKFTEVYGLEAPWMDPVGFGANVHRALDVVHRRALEGRRIEEEDIQPILERVWKRARSVDPESDREVRAAARDQISGYLREHGNSLERVVGSEGNFQFPFDEDVLSGKYDLLREEEGGEGIEVIDFKTSGFVDLETFGIDLQLDLYAMGVERDRAVEVSRRIVHFLRDGQVHGREWSDEREEHARERLRGVVDRIKAQDFTPNTEYCIHCEAFRSICPYAKVEEVGS